MRAIDADALQIAIVEEGQANKRKKYTIGDIWELTGAEIREVINSQPTIQPEPQWIPVEQELPEYGKAVLTVTQDETYEVNHVIDEECGEWFWEDNGKVIAWQPLPEPFKGVTDGRD